MTDVVARKRTLAQDRVAKGLCPRCGKEAAPYRLCAECRGKDSIGRLMERWARDGGLEHTTMPDGKKGYKIKDHAVLDAIKDRPLPLWGEGKANDARTRPRLGGVPVDLEAEIIGLLRAAGRPISIHDIVLAWGRLREKRQAGTIASNVAAIVAADQRRATRNAKRVAAAKK